MRNKYQRQRNAANILLKIIGAIICFYLLVALIGVIFDKDWKNPAERNYICFKNDSIDNVIDSMYSFKKMIINYPFPKYEDSDAIGFRYYNKLLTVSDIKVGKLCFDTLRSNEVFEKFTNEQIIRFINIFKYLYENDVTPSYFNLNNDVVRFGYKNYYYMYNGNGWSSELNRSLEIVKKKPYDFYFFNTVLDSFGNIYLTAERGADIWADSIEYKKKE